MAIEVLWAGPLTTVQDLGRIGHAAQGYPACGACDKPALRLANLLCGNDEGLAGLECTLAGPTLRFERATVIALAGAQMPATLDGAPCPLSAPVFVPAGAVLALGAATAGLRGYLAVAGGIDVPPLLSSRATDLKTRLGGYQGRALAEGDVLPVRETANPGALQRTLAKRAQRMEPTLLHPGTPLAWLGGSAMPVLRAVPGPQDDAFTGAAFGALAKGIYTVSADSNRMAARLKGPRLESVRGVDILSDGIVEGSVQVSADGQPIVMLADHQTTGGYAKIATVLPCDIPALAQARPGEPVRFRLVSRDAGMEAMRLARARWTRLRELLTSE